VSPAWRWIVLALLAVFVLGLIVLAVTSAQDGDYSAAAQGAGAGLALLMFGLSIFKRLREGGE